MIFSNPACSEITIIVQYIHTTQMMATTDLPSEASSLWNDRKG